MKFASRGEAKGRAREIAKSEDGRKVYPYECRTCGLWHLTSQNGTTQRRYDRKMGRR